MPLKVRYIVYLYFTMKETYTFVKLTHAIFDKRVWNAWQTSILTGIVWLMIICDLHGILSNTSYLKLYYAGCNHGYQTRRWYPGILFSQIVICWNLAFMWLLFLKKILCYLQWSGDVTCVYLSIILKSCLLLVFFLGGCRLLCVTVPIQQNQITWLHMVGYMWKHDEYLIY